MYGGTYSEWRSTCVCPGRGRIRPCVVQGLAKSTAENDLGRGTRLFVPPFGSLSGRIHLTRWTF